MNNKKLMVGYCPICDEEKVVFSSDTISHCPKCDHRLNLRPFTPIEITNEDGTPVGFEYPKNPLEEKWKWLYPPIPMPQYSQVCDGYSCMWCGRCPSGEYWKVPEEDKEVWEQYQAEVREYHRMRNPELFKMLGGE